MRPAFLLITLCAAALCPAAEDPGVFLSYGVAQDHAPTADPASAPWNAIPARIMSNDRYGHPVSGAETELRSVWTPSALYFLFVAKYRTLYLRPQPDTTSDTWGLWDYDVDEVFIGWDLNHIRRYKEFEVSPQGEWIDLDVDRDRTEKPVDASWNSGFENKTRIDRERSEWICEMRIPWKAIDPVTPSPGHELRVNLYRIEGAPPDRIFLAWRPVDSDSFHTPEKFGLLKLVEK